MNDSKKILILSVVGIVLVAAFLYTMISGSDTSNEPTACTQEAKQCSDGSFVGRTGPNCEFAACPEPESTTTEKAATSSEEAETDPEEPNYDRDAPPSDAGMEFPVLD